MSECHSVVRFAPRLPAAFAALALLAPAVALAGAGVDAKALLQQNCISCHGSEIYTRTDRRVTSLPALGSQVRQCEQNLGLTWFDEDVDAVTGLLNQDYYKFQP